MKYYRVKKENFLWEVGTILKEEHYESGSVGYVPKDEVFKNEFVPEEYISSEIVENTPEYFERVYEVNGLTKVYYETKDKAKEIIKKQYKK